MIKLESRVSIFFCDLALCHLPPQGLRHGGNVEDVIELQQAVCMWALRDPDFNKDSPKSSQMIDSFGTNLIERNQYSQLSELLNSTLVSTVSSFCGPFSHSFLEREGEELVTCSLYTKASFLDMRKVLKMEKRNSFVRKHFDKNNLQGGVFIVARYSWGIIHHDRGSHGGSGRLHASWSWQYQSTSEPGLLWKLRILCKQR